MHRSKLVVTVLFLVSAISHGEGLRGDALVQRVEQLAEAALSESGAVGLSVAVSAGDEMLVEKGYGVIELEHDVPANGDSVFRIGSITKQFTAAVVMKMIEDGASKNGKKLTLDAPIADFLEFPTQGREVTVRHLLTHTSGIKSYTGLGEPWVRTIPLEFTHEQLLELVADREFDFEPNEQYRYNNTGYYLLGVLIEEVGGQPYADAVAEMLFEPHGLTHIRYGSNSAVIRNRAQGYTVVDGEVVNDGLIGMSQPGAAGALISNAGDLVRWSRLLAQGKVVSAKSYGQMTTPHTLADGASTGYGFGLAIGELEGIPSISHGGGINGFNSMLAHYPDHDLTVAVISNSEFYRSSKLAEQIARAALGRELEVLDLEITAQEQERVEGVYTLTGTPIELTILARDGKLFSHASGQGETRLRSQGANDRGATEYRPDFDHGVRLVFEPGSPSPSLTLFQGGAEIAGPRKP